MKSKIGNIRPGIEKQYLFVTVILFIFIWLLYLIQDTIGYETVSMILLLIIFILPLFNFSRGPIILASVISALAWDYYFIPPHFTMHIAKAEDVMMLLMFFVVAVTNGVLAARINIYKDRVVRQERRLTALYNLVKGLSESNSIDDVLDKTVHHIGNVFGLETVIFLPENPLQLSRTPHPSSNFTPDEMEWLAAEAAFKVKSPGGNTTHLVGNAEAFYYPVFDRNGTVVCMIGVKMDEALRRDKQEMEFLRSFLSEVTRFLENNPVYSRP
jgi:two-component system sensor histidine kinase KdpD